MKLHVLLVASMASACSCPGGKLVQALNGCGEPCHPDNRLSINRGVCHDGTMHCDEDGGMECLGFIGPGPEICDGLDNDCDGWVDEDLKKTCSNECGNGQQVCLIGEWSPCNAPQPSPEVCDGIDNDCDGQIDEQTDLPVEFCYTGPPGTASLGICHPGSTRCIDGQSVCMYEQTPVPEICDGIDNDCNGLIDDGITALPLDLVVIMDNSCSMQSSTWKVQQAVVAWVAKYANVTNRRYALVTAPDNDWQAWGNNPRLYQNFTDVATFSSAVNAQVGDLGSGWEPTLDALDDLLSVNNPLGLSWSPYGMSRRAIIVFSDENPQSTWTPEITIPMVMAESAGKTVPISIFTDRTYFDAGIEWDMIANASGGMPGLEIHVPVSQIESELDVIIQDAACGP